MAVVSMGGAVLDPQQVLKLQKEQMLFIAWSLAPSSGQFWQIHLGNTYTVLYSRASTYELNVPELWS